MYYVVWLFEIHNPRLSTLSNQTITELQIWTLTCSHVDTYSVKHSLPHSVSTLPNINQ